MEKIHLYMMTYKTQIKPSGSKLDQLNPHYWISQDQDLLMNRYVLVILTL